MTPTPNQPPVPATAGRLNPTRTPHWTFVALASASLASCSLDDALKAKNTNTVPVPPKIDIPETVTTSSGISTTAEAHLQNAILTDTMSDWGDETLDLGNPSFASRGQRFITDQPNSYNRSNIAAAWGGRGSIPAPEVKRGGFQEPAIPAITPPSKKEHHLSLSEFRELVFGSQQSKEAGRFRDAIAADAEDGNPQDSGDPRVQAAYQIYRLNLMESLAGAERSYWRLHFAERRSEIMNGSLDNLAAIHDKARIGVMKENLEMSDITDTAKLISDRRNLTAETEAIVIAATAELTSYYDPVSNTEPAARKNGHITVDPPSNPTLPSGVTALVEKARETNPKYLIELIRLGETESDLAKDEIENLNNEFENRVRSSFEKVKEAYKRVQKAKIDSETFNVGLSQNLINYTDGLIGLAAISAFESGMLKAEQAQLEAIWDYHNAVIDLELEVGDFLQTRGQEKSIDFLLR